MKMHDSLDQSQRNFDLGNSQHSNSYYNQIPTNKILQNTYKQQLDDQTQQRNLQKQQEKQRLQRQKDQYNQRLQMNQQSERMKQISYRNYYSMLLNNQKQIQQNYISPFAERDIQKNHHIDIGVQMNKKKMDFLDQERRRLEQERKNNYRNQLMGQMEQKKRRQLSNHYQTQKSHQQYRKYSRLPEQIKKMERDRKWEEMSKYKEDLDRVRHQKEDINNRGRINSVDSRQSQPSVHHPFINPLPFNIQNPYILKQINAQASKKPF